MLATPRNAGVTSAVLVPQTDPVPDTSPNVTAEDPCTTWRVTAQTRIDPEVGAATNCVDAVTVALE
jgi:hypothetical protein